MGNNKNKKWRYQTPAGQNSDKMKGNIMERDKRKHLQWTKKN